MHPDEVRAMIAAIEARIRLRGDGSTAVEFAVPTADDLSAAGVAPSDARRVVSQPWWSEMVADVLETPEFAGPEETPEQVLQYARDVIGEYVGKRFDP